MTLKIIKLINYLYHGLFPSSVATCRFRPTCSQHAVESIEKYGAIKGSYLSLLRILNCHPFSKRPLYDPA